MLVEIGPPVFLGGLTTFLGIAPLWCAGSRSAVAVMANVYQWSTSGLMLTWQKCNFGSWVFCSLASSTIFRTFFKMFAGIIFYGVGHGLVRFMQRWRFLWLHIYANG